MAQVIDVVVLILLVAFAVDAVLHGRWSGTWCATGRPRDGYGIPGGRAADPRAKR